MASFASHQQHARQQQQHHHRHELSRVASVSSISSLSSSTSAVLLFAPPPPQLLRPASSLQQQQQQGSSPSIGSSASLGPEQEQEHEQSTVLYPSHAGDGTFSLDLSSAASVSSSSVGGESSNSSTNDSARHFQHVYQPSHHHHHQGYRWHKLTAAALDTLDTHSTAADGVLSEEGSSWTGAHASTTANSNEEDSYLALSAGLTIHRVPAGRSRKRRAALGQEDDRSSQKRSNRSTSSAADEKENIHHPATPRPIALKDDTTPRSDVFLGSIVRHFVDDETMDLLRRAPRTANVDSSGELATTPRATSPVAVAAHHHLRQMMAMQQSIVEAREQAERKHGLARLMINHSLELEHPIDTILEDEDEQPESTTSLAHYVRAYSREDGEDQTMIADAPETKMTNRRPFDRTSRSRSVPDLFAAHEAVPASTNDFGFGFDDEYGSLFFRPSSLDPSTGPSVSERRSKTPPPPSSSQARDRGRGSPWGGEFDEHETSALQAAITYWRRVLSAFRWTAPTTIGPTVDARADP